MFKKIIILQLLVFSTFLFSKTAEELLNPKNNAYDFTLTNNNSLNEYTPIQYVDKVEMSVEKILGLVPRIFNTFDCKNDVYGNDYCPASLAPADVFWDSLDGYSTSEVGMAIDYTNITSDTVVQPVSQTCLRSTGNLISENPANQWGIYVPAWQGSYAGFEVYVTKISDTQYRIYYRFRADYKWSGWSTSYMNKGEVQSFTWSYRRDVTGFIIDLQKAVFHGLHPKTLGIADSWDLQNMPVCKNCGSNLSASELTQTTLPNLGGTGWLLNNSQGGSTITLELSSDKKKYYYKIQAGLGAPKISIGDFINPVTDSTFYNDGKYDYSINFILTNDYVKVGQYGNYGSIYSFNTLVCYASSSNCPNGYTETTDAETTNGECKKTIEYTYYNYLCNSNTNTQGYDYVPTNTGGDCNPKETTDLIDTDNDGIGDSCNSSIPPKDNCKREGYKCKNEFEYEVFTNGTSESGVGSVTDYTNEESSLTESSFTPVLAKPLNIGSNTVSINFNHRGSGNTGHNNNAYNCGSVVMMNNSCIDIQGNYGGRSGWGWSSDVNMFNIPTPSTIKGTPILKYDKNVEGGTDHGGCSNFSNSVLEPLYNTLIANQWIIKTSSVVDGSPIASPEIANGICKINVKAYQVTYSNSMGYYILKGYSGTGIPYTSLGNVQTSNVNLYTSDGMFYINGKRIYTPSTAGLFGTIYINIFFDYVGELPYQPCPSTHLFFDGKCVAHSIAKDCPSGYTETTGTETAKGQCKSTVNYTYYSYKCSPDETVLNEGGNIQKVDTDNTSINTDILSSDLNSSIPPNNNCKKVIGVGKAAFVDGEWKCSPFMCNGDMKCGFGTCEGFSVSNNNYMSSVLNPLKSEVKLNTSDCNTSYEYIDGNSTAHYIKYCSNGIIENATCLEKDANNKCIKFDTTNPDAKCKSGTTIIEPSKQYTYYTYSCPNEKNSYGFNWEIINNITTDPGCIDDTFGKCLNFEKLSNNCKRKTLGCTSGSCQFQSSSNQWKCVTGTISLESSSCNSPICDLVLNNEISYCENEVCPTANGIYERNNQCYMMLCPDGTFEIDGKCGVE